jgi:arginine decarboxylase
MWNIDKAREAYNIAHWGGGYFDVGEAGENLGHLLVRPDRDPQQAGIDLHALTDEIQQAGLALPVLVRFTGILHDRVGRLCDAFSTATKDHHYHGQYTAVYPIKVNQQQSVVHELLDRSQQHPEHHVGLEAGSKPELMAVLALSNPEGGVIVCNGYKDREYIRLALIGEQLGHKVYIVLEKPAELELVIEEARRMQITPRLGIRVRLASIGRGNWQNTGGEKSKFGLSAAQVLYAVERLREADMLDALNLLHCHMGSQLANIRDIRHGLRECARYYTELHALGARIGVVDVGGGLGIDYEGTRSRSLCSMNYSLQEYANNVVHTLWEACAEHNLPHPDIFTESGRALTAHHAVLITEVVDVEHIASKETVREPEADAPLVLHDLWHGLVHFAADNPDTNTARAAIEVYHDATHALSEAHAMYVHGVVTLAQKAHAEELYFAICREVRQLMNSANRAHRETLDELNEKLADKYFCNFSLFQSLPDVWAIEQIFPIAPLNRLNEEPTRRGTLQDITCDSDGRIDHYVDGEGIESSLPLHEPRKDESYRLGIFLIGAYQEILGDMHNLFGDTNAVNVHLDEQGGYQLEQLQQGDTVDEVLRYVHFEPETLMAAYRQKVAATTLPAEIQQAYLAELEDGLQGYTYLEE